MANADPYGMTNKKGKRSRKCEGDCGWGDSHPTHRKKRDGGGTRLTRRCGESRLKTVEACGGAGGVAGPSASLRMTGDWAGWIPSGAKGGVGCRG